MEQFIKIVWLRDRHALMQFELGARDEEAAWRLFHRVCAVLRALVNQETRGQEGGSHVES